MSSNATSLSNLRRLGYRSVQRTQQQQPALDRFKSSSQDLLNENNIKSRLEEELNWFEGSRPAKSIENLLAPSENSSSRIQAPSKSRTPVQGNVDEKKRRLISQGLFNNQPSSSVSSSQSRLPKPTSIMSQLKTPAGSQPRSFNSSNTPRSRLQPPSSTRSSRPVLTRQSPAQKTTYDSRCFDSEESESEAELNFPPPPPEMASISDNEFLYSASSRRTSNHSRVPLKSEGIDTEGSEFSYRSGHHSTVSENARVEQMEEKLLALNRKVEQLTQSSDERTSSTEDKISINRRLSESERSKNELSRKYSKALETNADLQKQVEQLQKELVQKQNQIINVKQVSAAVFAQFNSLRSEISSARRAQIDMRRTMQNELQQVQASIITMIEDYEVTQAPRVNDYTTDTLSRLQQDRAKVERQKAEYHNDADIVDEIIATVENIVERMRNDAVEKRSIISRKDVESLGLQLMNIAGKIGDLKDRFPDLRAALSALGSKEASSLELEQSFLEEEPTRVDACMEKCKALTQTLTTLKKLAGVQEARTKNYESHSLRRRGPNYDDPQEMLKDVNQSIRELMPVNHQKRAEILEKMEPRYAMRKYRNQNIERTRIEKLLQDRFETLNITDNLELIAHKREEALRNLYLMESLETRDTSRNNQTSNGGAHLPLGGGTVPRNHNLNQQHSQKRLFPNSHGNQNLHRRQRSWDALGEQSTVDDLHITNAMSYATLRPNNSRIQFDPNIEKMAAISSPNLVRATMHMRGELNNSRPRLPQQSSMSTDQLIESELYNNPPKLRVETRKQERPASMFVNHRNHTDDEADFGPLIIDSVVQPSKNSSKIDLTEAKPKRSPEAKSKFGFGLRKGVFKRKTAEEKEKTKSQNHLDAHQEVFSAPESQVAPKSGHEEPSKRSFASRMASFSKRKKQTAKKIAEKNQEIPAQESSPLSARQHAHQKHIQNQQQQINSPKTTSRLPEYSQIRPPINSNNNSQQFLSPKPYRPGGQPNFGLQRGAPMSPGPPGRSIEAPKFSKTPQVRFETARGKVQRPVSTQEWSRPKRRNENTQSASFTGSPPPPTSPPSEGSSTARFGFGYQRPDSRMKTSDV